MTKKTAEINLLCCVGIYKKFDGSMHPELDYNKLKESQELKPKEESKSSLWKSFTGWVSKKIASFKSSGKPIKSFPVVNAFLSTYYNILIGRRPFSGSPITIMNDIVYIFNSLFKGLYHYDVSSQYHPRNSYIKQVRACCMVSLLMRVDELPNFYLCIFTLCYTFSGFE